MTLYPEFDTNSSPKRAKRKGARTLHLYVLLDRSGSMQVIEDDVIGGFNRLIADQVDSGRRVKVTLAQFDDRDPLEVLHTATPVGKVRPLTRDTFVPRGCTPLLDATGELLELAAVREADRVWRERRPESVLFATITDGHENASMRYTQSVVRQLVTARTAAGWRFIYLGAGSDVYGEALDLGYSPGSVQSWEADAEGAELAMHSLSDSVGLAADLVAESMAMPMDLFESKPAEEHRSARGAAGR